MWTWHHSYNIPKKGTQTLFAINNKNSEPLTRHRILLQKMEFHSGAATYQGT